MDCSPPGSSVHGILQARIMEWVATPFSRGWLTIYNSGIQPVALRLLHRQADILPLSHFGAKKLCESHFSLQISCPNLMSFPSSLSTYHTRLCRNFCSLKHNSKTSRNFFLLLSTSSWRKIVLTIDFSNLSIWFFSFFVRSETFAFSLEEITLQLPFGISDTSITALVLWGHYYW